MARGLQQNSNNKAARWTQEIQLTFGDHNYQKKSVNLDLFTFMANLVILVYHIAIGIIVDYCHIFFIQVEIRGQDTCQSWNY